MTDIEKSKIELSNVNSAIKSFNAIIQNSPNTLLNLKDSLKFLHQRVGFLERKIKFDTN